MFVLPGFHQNMFVLPGFLQNMFVLSGYHQNMFVLSGFHKNMFVLSGYHKNMFVLSCFHNNMFVLSGFHQNMFVLSGFRQSYSGSETSTDMSLSSTENLSSCSLRQEPQGEETHGLFPNTFDPNINGSDTYSILSRLGMPQSAVEVKAANSSTFYVTGSVDPAQAMDRRPDRDCCIQAFHRMTVDSSTQAKVVSAHSASQVAAQSKPASQLALSQHHPDISDDHGYSLSSSQPKKKSAEEASLLMRWHQQQQSNKAVGASQTTQIVSRNERSSKLPVHQPHKQLQTKLFVDSSLPCHCTSETQLEEWGVHMVKGTAVSTPANENWRQLDAAVSASTQHLTLPATLPNVLPSHAISSKMEVTNGMEPPRPATAPVTGRYAMLNVKPSSHADNILIRSGELRRSYERIDRLTLTHSQPDLTRLAKLQLAPSMGVMQLRRHNQRPRSVESTDSLSFNELTAVGDR